MQTYSFRTRISDEQESIEAIADRVYAAGGDDALVSRTDEGVYVDFDRAGPDALSAVSSALRTLTAARFSIQSVEALGEADRECFDAAAVANAGIKNPSGVVQVLSSLTADEKKVRITRTRFASAPEEDAIAFDEFRRSA